MMAVAALKQPTGIQAVHAGVAGSCDGLGELLSSLTATCSRVVGIVLSVLRRAWSSLSLSYLGGSCSHLPHIQIDCESALNSQNGASCGPVTREGGAPLR